MIFHLYTVRGGKLLRLTTHSTREEALEAAGRPEATTGDW
jgi:hypothetical protein